MVKLENEWTEHPTRFEDRGEYLAEFLDEAWVLCPSCGADGVVRSEIPYWSSTPRFTCSSCSLRLVGRHSKWFGPAQGVARRRCGGCGRRLEEKLSAEHGIVHETRICCARCGTTSTAPVSWSLGPPQAPYEPAFGLRLRLQTPCRGSILWVYNHRHLRFLEEYVSASLRRREPNRNGSLASRLPKWLKSAANRRDILKSIDKLKAAALEEKSCRLPGYP